MNEAAWFDDPPLRSREVVVERGVPCRMRDGTVLLADVYRPCDGGPCPVLLLRHPYDRTHAEMFSYLHPSWYARRGFVVVVQDCRGRWSSGGEWYPFRHEEEDGADTVAWAAGLPGSDGRVAMYGFSYAGSTQLLAAASQPRGLAAIMPAMTSADFHDGWTYRGGALQHAFTRSWAIFLAQDTAARAKQYDLEVELARTMRGVREEYWSPLGGGILARDGVAPYYLDWLRHEARDGYWQQWSIRTRHQRIAVPALHIGGWYDVFLGGTLENFTALRAGAATDEARRGQRLVIGPWFHNPWHPLVGAVDLGDSARSRIDALQIRWLDAILRGEPNGLADEPPVALFVLGDDRWRSEDAWPPPGMYPLELFLSSSGRANSSNGDGALVRAVPSEEPPDVFVYNPRDPVPSVGGHSCCNDQIAPMGSFDQRALEVRMDVLVYTGEPLERDLLVIGPVSASIFAASSACDTDFTAKLVDVHPDGRALNVCEGIVRARFRDSLEVAVPIEPDRVYAYTIDLGATAIRFRRGHRIRLEVSSSSFPSFDRNPNAFVPIVDAGPADWVVATQTVFHDGARPSRLVLPVLPA